MMPISGFTEQEFRDRCTRAQDLMKQSGLAALLLTCEADVRYFTGYLTRFWESPTRPWFLVVPAAGKPVAVIPTIGAALMKSTWIDDIRTWRSPDYSDDGIGLLTETLCELVAAGERIGVPSGQETHLRMPLKDWERLRVALADRFLTDDAEILRALRMVKSEAEIAKIRAACSVADRAFARVPDIAQAGTPLNDVFRQFQMLCLEEGADCVPYLAGGAGQAGYMDVISPATQAPLVVGDVLMLDTGVMRDGYFCDFDRNFSVGTPSRETTQVHARLIEATEAAFQIAHPGAECAELFTVMDGIVTGGQGGSDAGRLGHGLGMQLTEPPSLLPSDRTVLEPGMVLTLEPGVEMPDGRIMVHEENIVIRAEGAEWLSTPRDTGITVLQS